MSNVKTKVAAILLAATTTLTMTNCKNINEELNDNEVIEDEYYKYDNSDFDLYQVVTINYKGKPEMVLAKLYATPASANITYKLIADTKIVYEYNRETNTLTSDYEILDINPLSSYLTDDIASNLTKMNDDEVINIFYKEVINKEEVKGYYR